MRHTSCIVLPIRTGRPKLAHNTDTFTHPQHLFRTVFVAVAVSSLFIREIGHAVDRPCHDSNRCVPTRFRCLCVRYIETIRRSSRCVPARCWRTTREVRIELVLLQLVCYAGHTGQTHTTYTSRSSRINTKQLRSNTPAAIPARQMVRCTFAKASTADQDMFDQGGRLTQHMRTAQIFYLESHKQPRWKYISSL